MACRQCGIVMEDQTLSGLCSGCDLLEALPDKLASRKELGGLPFEDMKHLDEVDRIEKIVHYLRQNPGRMIAVMVDYGGAYKGKGDRWIRLISQKLPGAQLVKRRPDYPAKEIETLWLKYGK